MPTFASVFSSRLRIEAASLALASLILGAGCTPKIGDKCQISTDCSVRGDRLCDVSQPGGYCTQINCQGGSCPADESYCVLFESAIPGCSYDDRNGPQGARTARSFCVATCTTDKDCRGGYVCADPKEAPWNAAILDDDQGKLTCLPQPAGAIDAGVSIEPTPVCSVLGPTVAPIDAGAATVHDAGLDVPPLFPSNFSGNYSRAR